MPKPTYLVTLAYAATLAETSVAETQRILDELGAQPMFVVNMTPLYDAAVAGTLICRAKAWTDQAAYHRRFDTPSEIQADG